MSNSTWDYCISHLQSELPAQQFNTWIRPLTPEMEDESVLRLAAPNRFVLDWVNDKYKDRIQDLLNGNSALVKKALEIVVIKRTKNTDSSRSFQTQREGNHHNASPRQDQRPEQVPVQQNLNVTTPSTDLRGGSLDQPFGQAPLEQQAESYTEPRYETPHAQTQGNVAPVSGHNTTELVLEGQSFDQAARVSPQTAQQPVAYLGEQTHEVQQPVRGMGSPAAEHAPADNGQENATSPGATADLLRGVDPGQNQANTASMLQINTEPKEQPKRNRVNKSDVEGGLEHKSNLNKNFIFNNFVVGKSNQLGLAAASQVSENPGGAYNPLFIYGGVGLGKTHLMHAVGNALCDRQPGSKVIYLHSERFVADMVKALQLNAINDFKRYYRSVDALLIDDIQFFAGKERSQEEFFHTFNALLEGGQQIIVTCDRYLKEIDGLEERLKSRFGWGLTVAIEPPELETRVAILKKKADQVSMNLPNDAAFFIAQRIRSNVRELEGALKRVIANAHFTGREISIDLVRESLKDLLALQDRLVSIDNIQRMVAEYYKIKVSDLLSKRRNRSVARPRQVAMYLAKDLTHHSLPEIGEVFGGRDHTTVLHACRKIKELLESDADIKEDVKNLLRILTT